LSQYFLGVVYTNGEKKLYELIEFDKKSFLRYKILYANPEMLKELYHTPGNVFDFEIKNDYLLWDGPTVEIDPDSMRHFDGKHTVISNNIETVYDYLIKLSRLDAWYVRDESAEEFISSGRFPEYGATSFSSLKVSSSTMRVYLSILTEEGWRSRAILSYAGSLKFESFKFIIKSSQFFDLGLSECIEEIAEVRYGGELYKVCVFSEGMSIYPDFSPSFRLLDPVVNMKMDSILKDQSAAELLDFFVVSMKKALFPEDEERLVVTKDYSYVSDTDKSGAFFKYSLKKPRKDKLAQLFKLTSDMYDGRTLQNWDIAQLKDFMVSSKLDATQMYACLALLGVYESVTSNMLDRIDSAQASKIEYLVSSLEQELELFAIRAYICLTDYKLPTGELHILSGGNCTGYTELRKVGLGGAAYA
jgi:hypothetical protein